MLIQQGHCMNANLPGYLQKSKKGARWDTLVHPNWEFHLAVIAGALCSFVSTRWAPLVQLPAAFFFGNINQGDVDQAKDSQIC